MFSRKLFCVLALLPVAAAFLIDYLSSVCLGRANIFYYITGIPLLINLLTYHNWAFLLGYQDGDYSTRAPLICEVFYASHESVGIELAKAPAKLEDGVAYRTNNLGYLRLTKAPFTCTDYEVYSEGYCGIGLGMPNVDHSKIRPFLDEVLGSGDALAPWGTTGNFWTFESLRAKAEAFLAGKDSLVLGRDMGNFVLIEIHERVLGITFTKDEAQEIQDFMEDFLFDALFLEVPIITNNPKRRADRANYVARYKTALEAKITNGQITTLSMEDTLLAAEGLMDFLTFAGIPSLTGVSAAVLGVYLHNLGGTNDMIDYTNHEDLGRVIMEATRVYPPVLGFAYVEGNTRYEPLPGYSGYDFSVFGADSHEFRVRFDTVQEYRDRTLNWADSAAPVAGKPETSHICPGRSLAFNLLLAFLSEMDIESWMEGPSGKPDVQPNGSGPQFWDDFKIVKI